MTSDQQRGYRGLPVTKGPPQPERCMLPACRKVLSAADRARKAWLCEEHTGLADYAARLKASSEAARQRCLEAYPVCAGCGVKLSDEAIKAGRTRHTREDLNTCL